MSRIVRRIVVVALVGVVAAVAAAVITGRLHYVSTHGVSMTPTYHAGELVIVARTDGYHVGQIAAYRNPADGVLVLHRIVGGDARGWVFKGDNNQSEDIAHPTSDQLLGRAIFNVAGLGRFVASPIALAVAAGAVLLLVFGIAGWRLRRRHAAPARAAATAKVPHARRRRRRRWIIAGLLVADTAAIAAFAGAVLFPVRPGAAPTPIEQTATFRYNGTTAVSTTYPDGEIRTGDPVFTKLATDVTLQFDYVTDAPAADVSGSIGLELEIANRTGWSTRREAVPSTALVGGTVHLDTTLDLAEVQSLVDSVSTESGVPSGAIDIVVRATGTVTTAGAPASQIEFTLPLQLTPLQMSLTANTPQDSAVSDTDDGRAVVAQRPIATTAPPAAPTGLVPADTKRLLFFALLAVLALSIACWPEPLPAVEDSASGDTSEPEREPEPELEPRLDSGVDSGPISGVDVEDPSPIAEPVNIPVPIVPASMIAVVHAMAAPVRTTGSFPNGIACDGINVWVANSGGNSVSCIDPVTNTRTDHPTGAGPRGIALDGTFVWVTNTDANTVSRIDPVTKIRIDYPTGDGPQGIALDGSHIWISNSRGNTVSRIDPATGERADFSVGNNPAGIVFDGWNLWVANFGSGTVSRIDPRETPPGVAVQYTVGPNPFGVAFDGRHVWVSNFGSNTVAKIDPRDAAPGNAVHYTVGGNPRGLAYDGRDIWAANYSDDTVTRIDPEATGHGAFLTYPTGTNPCGVSCDGSRVWVTNFSANTVSVIELRHSARSGPAT